MRYAETYSFATKRVRVAWWRLLWVLAATLRLERVFGIRCARRYLR